MKASLQNNSIERTMLARTGSQEVLISQEILRDNDEVLNIDYGGTGELPRKHLRNN